MRPRRWAARRPWRVAALVLGVGVLALLAAVLVRDQLQPVFAGVPTDRTIPGTVRCFHGDGLAASGGSRRPWVDADPDGAVVLWVPGLNRPPCSATGLTRLDAASAEALASQVRHAQSASGSSSCPMDEGRGATVFLTYPGQTEAEVARFSFTGCLSVTAPGRGYRRLDATAATLLVAIAPPSMRTK